MPVKPLLQNTETGRWELALKTKPRAGVCLVDGCGRPQPNKAHGKKAGKVCPACLIRRWRANNPALSSFNQLKVSARRRGKEFTLTFEEFRGWCLNNGYLDGRGRLRDSLHVDRHDDSKGYNLENIRVLTNRENILKEQARRKKIRQELTRQNQYIPTSLRPENDPVYEEPTIEDLDPEDRPF